MKILPQILILSIIILLFVLPFGAQTRHSSRILFVPIDDRPPTAQWVVKMGEIGDVEVVAPPHALLGKFTEFGKSDEIIKWLGKQNLQSFDAAVISIDMLAYGGLVAMREFQTDEQTAQKRLDFIRELKRRAPKLKIYVSSVIMRLAPTGNLVNESYRANLAEWAEISVDPNLKAKTAQLERQIPAKALEDYKAARRRDLKINLAAIKLVQDKVVEQLILGQDDAKPKGVHVADRERLISEVKNLNLQSKIGVQPGADELSMLQLARSLSDKYNYRPKIKAIYSSEKIRNQVMPYEDRPLHKTVSFQIESVGAKEVQSESEADILFYVYASRFENGRAESFANTILKTIETEKTSIKSRKPLERQIIVADVDPKGDVQGADPKFTELLRNNLAFKNIAGYAAWNTAGNTIGTALPHGMIYALSQKQFGFPSSNWKISRAAFLRRTQKNTEISYAQTWFLLNRLLDDYVYHSIVRPEAQKFARERKWNPFRFSPSETKEVENFISSRVKESIRKNLNYISPLSDNSVSYVICEDVENYVLTLPWGRTFEAEIDYRLKCSQINPPVFKKPNKR